jgi:hypothetical protein
VLALLGGIGAVAVRLKTIRSGKNG